MSDTATDDGAFEGQLVLSPHLDYFRHGEEFYIHHNLFGYILKMSEDVLEFLEFFRDAPRSEEEVLRAFRGRFSDDMIAQFSSVLAAQSCLLAPGADHTETLHRMYPVPARFIVAHQPTDGHVRFFVLDQQSKAAVHVIELDDWASTLWRMIDGETTVDELIDAMTDVEGSPHTGVDQKVLATLGHLTHCDTQLLKMSMAPASTYKFRRHGTPPYLISSMPYERVTQLVIDSFADEEDDAAPKTVAPPSPLDELSGVETHPIAEEQLVRDVYENRLASLFAEPHPALHDDTYGGALCKHLLAHDAIPSDARVLEIGGSGVLARGFLVALDSANSDLAASVHYTLAAPSSVLAEAARANLKDAPEGANTDVVQVDVESLENLEGPFDLILTNEYIANLETVQVRKIDPVDDGEDLDEEEAPPPAQDTDGREEDDGSGEGETPSTPPSSKRPKVQKRATFIGEGDAVSQILRFNLPLDDAPNDLHLNTGAIRLLERMHALATDTAQIVVIEFGERFRYPVRTSEDEGDAWSIHFHILDHIAHKLGYETDFDYVMEVLDFERETPMLATTRSQFKALRHLFETLGDTLARRAWTEDAFEAKRAEHDLEGDRLIDITYEPLEDRVLGVVPHSIKMLHLHHEERAPVENEDEHAAKTEDAGPAANVEL